jgi:hypothetical protein
MDLLEGSSKLWGLFPHRASITLRFSGAGFGFGLSRSLFYYYGVILNRTGNVSIFGGN